MKKLKWKLKNILVFMKRVCGPEKYYLFDNTKSLRENLEGKGMVRTEIVFQIYEWAFSMRRLFQNSLAYA